MFRAGGKIAIKSQEPSTQFTTIKLAKLFMKLHYNSYIPIMTILSTVNFDIQWVKLRPAGLSHLLVVDNSSCWKTPTPVPICVPIHLQIRAVQQLLVFLTWLDLASLISTCHCIYDSSFEFKTFQLFYEIFLINAMLKDLMRIL